MDLVGSTVTRPAPAASPAAQAEPQDAPGLRDLSGNYAGRQVWHISCGDVINRDRCLTVLVNDQNKVVLVGPPGETAVLSSGQLGQLRDALREAAEQAER
ncbi:hypothetical protein ALI144C_42980 [Actinosynnema sp. ALI-1.44]|uniref:hypothetical protein n=1 Tax=Actinosynnema sp. ALI-1.44 TaxID=1933779 RepID=UPI00097CB42E|nr:hypothetical protein [Actinosynnema sp. ALI-1.44]ONI72774.1 hypothetical protein ALI144C_42980 [Actinosynnema sp. ALI-1.44]